MRSGFGVAAAAVLWALVTPAVAAECPGNPDALGVSRVLVVDPTEHIRLGSMQYRETLPLADKEVVLTFDDGPIPPYSNRVLEALAAECVKATYFIVGMMARAYPDLVRQIAAAGHTIGTHSQNHPMTFGSMPLSRAQREIDTGIKSVADALGDPHQVAPFFRIPGLLRTGAVEGYLADQRLMLWSADFPADDWRRIGADTVIRRAMQRLDAKGRGILLLHDMQPATAIALPRLLRELKVGGYRIVHVVPAAPGRPPTVTVASQWRANARSTDRHDLELIVPPYIAGVAPPAIALASYTDRDLILDVASQSAAAVETLPSGVPSVQRQAARKPQLSRSKPIRASVEPEAAPGGLWPISALVPRKEIKR